MDQAQQWEQLITDYTQFFTVWETFWDHIYANLAQFQTNPFDLMAHHEELSTNMLESISDSSDSSTEEDDDNEEEDSSMDEDSCSITNIDSVIDDSSSEAESFAEEDEDLFSEHYEGHDECCEVEEDDCAMDQDGRY